MKILSFAFTSPALLAGVKSVTRRDWHPDYARRFHPGDLVQVWDHSPRQHGRQIATIRIVSVRRELDSDAPDSDYEAEGFAWLEAHPEHLPTSRRVGYMVQVSRAWFDHWRESGGASWVVRFEVVTVTGAEA